MGRTSSILSFCLLIAFLLGSTTIQAQTSASASALYSASVIGELRLSVSTPGAISGLSKGITYTLDPDPAAANAISPIVNGGETGTPMEIEITAAPGANVELNFSLPASLNNGSAGNLLCAFSADGLVNAATGERFNPNAPLVLHIGDDSSEAFLLGIIVTVPPNAPEGDYAGTVTLLATITGL